MKFSIKDFLSKGDQIRRKLRIWSNLLKKSLIENFGVFCAMYHHAHELCAGLKIWLSWEFHHYRNQVSITFLELKTPGLMEVHCHFSKECFVLQKTYWKYFPLFWYQLQIFRRSKEGAITEEKYLTEYIRKKLLQKWLSQKTARPYN